MTPNDDFAHDDEHKMTDAEGDWVANEPPVDDFGDPSGDAAGASVSAGDDMHQHEEMAPAVEPTKNKLPIIAAIAGVIVLAIGGGLAYMHFSNGPRDADSMMLDRVAENAATETVPNFAPAAPKPVSSEAPKALPAAAAPVANDVAPTTSFTTPSAAPAANDVTAKMPDVLPVVQPQETTNPAPVAVATPAPQAAPVVSAPVAKQVVVEVAPQNQAASDARLAVLQSRIDDLQKALGQTTQQVGQISEKLTVVAPASGSAPVSAQPDVAMEERLNKLEQKLLQMEQHQGASVSRAAAVDAVYPSHVSKKSHHTVKAKAKLVKAPKESTKTKWVLRAATPGEAWVAKDASTRELRPLHVGDEFGPVGKVTAIRQVGDAWLVQGTTGTVK